MTTVTRFRLRTKTRFVIAPDFSRCRVVWAHHHLESCLQNGYTAFLHAVHRARLGVARYLKEKGANVRALLYVSICVLSFHVQALRPQCDDVDALYVITWQSGDGAYQLATRGWLRSNVLHSGVLDGLRAGGARGGARGGAQGGAQGGADAALSWR